MCCSPCRVIRSSNISGPLPDAITTLRNLKYLDLSYNQIWPPVPAGLFSMPDLKGMLLGNNWLTNQPVPNMAKAPASLNMLSLRSVNATVDNSSKVGKSTLDLYGNPQICDVATGRPLNLSSTSGQFNDSCKWTRTPFCLNQRCLPTQYIDLPTFLNAYPPSNCIYGQGPTTAPLFPSDPSAAAAAAASATAQAVTQESNPGSSPPPGSAGPPDAAPGDPAGGGGAAAAGGRRGGGSAASAGDAGVPTGPGACECVGSDQFYEFDLLCANSTIQAWTDEYSQLVSQKVSQGFAYKLKRCINPEQVWVWHAYVSDWRLDSSGSPLFDMRLYVVLFGNFSSDDEILVQSVIVQNSDLLGDTKFGVLKRLGELHGGPRNSDLLGDANANFGALKLKRLVQNSDLLDDPKFGVLKRLGEWLGGGTGTR
ncbi:unnamed protein product [Closterium sp. Yama58-4]|nr:unnamed protein product [Closterium sp. Yama58-4]